MRSRVSLPWSAALLAPTLAVVPSRLPDGFQSPAAWRAVPPKGAAGAVTGPPGSDVRALAIDLELLRA